jgi:hypothetical protein
MDNWRRYGGDPNIVNSYVAATGSSDSLQIPRPNTMGTSSPAKGEITAAPVAPVGGQPTPSMTTPAGVKQNATVAPLTLGAQKQWIDQNKPTDPGAYQGPDPYSMHWGGALIGGSNTGIADYGNWQSQRDTYNQAMQKWQSEYDDWASRNKAQTGGVKQNATVAQIAQPAGQGWGVASTQQQNLGQSPTTQIPNPYAVPGQRSTAQPGTGPVQKPDKSLSKVNERYAGVL